MRQRILVLGVTGMLGSMVADFLSREPEFEVKATLRNQEMSAYYRERLGWVDWCSFEASATDVSAVPQLFAECDWVINCIGIIKPLIQDHSAHQIERAILINSRFPHLLARWTEGRARVIQIATDCVYSGTKGRYLETDPHDALDVYGKTKSLGEVFAPHVHHLRCSIVGPEAAEPKSLMEWLLNQPEGATVNGFVNHRWNGVTTLHFAKLCAGVIKGGISLPHVQHVLPKGEPSKFEMLKDFARCFSRPDISVRPTEAPVVIDRTLASADEQLNNKLWAAAGYGGLPTVTQMIEELAQFDYQSKAGRAYVRN